jgi:hydroxypyruvate reductase
VDDLARARDAIRRWFDAGIDAVEPRKAVTRSLLVEGTALRVGDHMVDLPSEGRVVVIAIGKAASGMAQGALDVLGDRIHSGVVLTKYGHLGTALPGFQAFEAGHPVPDENGLLATRAILHAVEGLASRDLVLALISGGGSALLELPVDGVSLDDLRTTTRALMHAGAGIHDLNTVRTRLSRVKGGGLRREIGEARCVTLLLSDVLGNDPATIASGPTVIPRGEGRTPDEVIAKFGIRDRLPASVRRALAHADRLGTTLDTAGDALAVVADNETFVRAVVQLAREEGLSVTHDPSPYDGDANDLGRQFVEVAGAAADDTDVIVRGGEATVEVLGDGTGGRNTEMALAAALAMERNDRWVIASLASDGDDGNSAAAGAIADGMTAERARIAGVDPAAALVRNDSATVFRAAGGLVVTGPTGTNVNDAYIALRRRALE